MTQLHDNGSLTVVSDAGGAADPLPADATDTTGPADGLPEHPRTDEHPAAVEELDLAAVAGLAVQLVAITQSLDALAASTAAIRAEVESIGEVLVQVSATASPTSVDGARPAPADSAGMSADDLVTQAVRLSTIWIERAHHHPLRAALVMMEGWTVQLQETVSRGRLLSSTAVDEALAEDECPSGRWLRSSAPDALDPVRAAEIRHLHSEHHRMAALVLAEVRDGRTDEARRLLESEDGYAGVVRRSSQAVRSWIDVLDEQPETGF